MSALPEDEDPFRRRLTETFERAVEAHRREAEALEELRLLLYVDRTAQDPEILDGLKEFAEHVASRKHPEGSIPADQFDTEQFVSRVRSRPEQ